MVLLIVALVGGRYVAESPTLAPLFTHGGLTIAWGMMAYGFIASVLPVWMLLCPAGLPLDLHEDRHHRAARARAS